MQYRISEFAEIKAYCDVFNFHGHKGFKEPVNPFLWWNFEHPGILNDSVHAYYSDGLIVVLELKNERDVSNMLVFSLCPSRNTLRKILDVVKNYGIINFNAEFGDKYRHITRKIDGFRFLVDGKNYYQADGGEAWVKLYGQQ